MRCWSQAFRWRARAATHDQAERERQGRERHEAERAAIEEMIRRLLQTSRALAAVAALALRLHERLLDTLEATTPADLALGDLPSLGMVTRAIVAAIELERRCYGDPTEILEQQRAETFEDYVLRMRAERGLDDEAAQPEEEPWPPLGMPP